MVQRSSEVCYDGYLGAASLSALTELHYEKARCVGSSAVQQYVHTTLTCRGLRLRLLGLLAMALDVCAPIAQAHLSRAV
jgi:hypothetical protein